MTTLTVLASVSLILWIALLVIELVKALKNQPERSRPPTLASAAVSYMAYAEGLDDTTDPFAVPTVVDDDFLTASPLGVQLGQITGRHLTSVLELLGHPDMDLVEGLTADLATSGDELVVEVRYYTEPWLERTPATVTRSSVYRVPVTS